MWNYDYKILEVYLDEDDYYDGDTFSCLCDVGRRTKFKTKIRLGDIDTWETRKPRGVSNPIIIEEHKMRGRLAKDAMADWLHNEFQQGHVVWVRSLDINEFDNFGRLLGSIFSTQSDGRILSLGAYLKLQGHAKYDLTEEEITG